MLTNGDFRYWFSYTSNKQKWDKKQEDKNIKKSKKEYEKTDTDRKFNKVSSYEWYNIEDYDNED